MTHFGYRAAQEFGYLKKKDVYAALNTQLKQEWERNGKADPLGKICLDMKLLTHKQLDTILETTLMEPNIDWGEKTNFAKMLNIEKVAKQTIGEYMGKRIAKRPKGETIFLSNSSTIYYVFRGMVKYGASVNVLTIHAAILAAYPSLDSKIRSVGIIWKGHVDLDNALIEPPDLNDPRTKAELDFLQGGVPHALISATGFDSVFGPMAGNITAREVTRRVLQSQTHTCVLIDCSKIKVGTNKHEPALLFREKEWRQIRDRGDVEVVINCHPQIPKEQANFKPSLRSKTEIRDIMSGQNASQSTIQEVLRYQEWSMSLGDILTEIPIDLKL